MPILRDDLLKRLTPHDKAIMTLLRKRPPPAYTAKELAELIRPDDLFGEAIIQVYLVGLELSGLVVRIPNDENGQTYWAKPPQKSRSSPSQ